MRGKLVSVSATVNKYLLSVEASASVRSVDQDALNQAIQEKMRLVNACIIGCIESIEDRAPTFEEYNTYLERIFGERFELYTWRGTKIVEVRYWPEAGGFFEVHSLVNPFEPCPIS